MNPFDDAAEIKRTQAEYRLQVAVAKHLDSAFPHLLYTAFPGRPGDAADGFHKKAMGVKSGVPDLLFFWPQVFAAIELKIESGVVSSQQNKFASSFVKAGGKFAVCRTVRQLHNKLKEWGVAPLHNAVTEPDYRSDNEKKRDAFAAFAPE